MKLQIVPIVNQNGIKYGVRRLGLIHRITGNNWLCYRFSFDGEYRFADPYSALHNWAIKEFRSPKEAAYSVTRCYGVVDIKYIDWCGK